MGLTLKSMPSYQDHCLREEHLAAQFSITFNATPANKQESVDIPGTMIVRAQGQTAAADAVETLAWTTPVDNSSGNSVFGLLLNLDLNKADKVYSVSVVSALGKTLSVTGPGAVAGLPAYLTAQGNIAIEIAATALNLATTSDSFVVICNYRQAKP